MIVFLIELRLSLITLTSRRVCPNSYNWAALLSFATRWQQIYLASPQIQQLDLCGPAAQWHCLSPVLVSWSLGGWVCRSQRLSSVYLGAHAPRASRLKAPALQWLCRRFGSLSSPKQEKPTHTPAGQQCQVLFVQWRRLCCFKFQVPQTILRDSIVPVLALITSVWLHRLFCIHFPTKHESDIVRKCCKLWEYFSAFYKEVDMHNLTALH